MKNANFTLGFLLLFVTLTQAQTLDWRQTYNTPNVSAGDNAQRIVTDATGNSVIANITAGVDGFKITVAKINNTGIEQWRYSTSEIKAQIYINDLKLDGSGNVFVVGSAHIDETKGQDMFLLKLSSAGSLVFHKYSGNSNNSFTYKDEGKKVLIDASGYSYLFGQIENSKKMRLVKYAASGTQTWSIDINISGSIYNNSYIAADMLFNSTGDILLYCSSYHHATGKRELAISVVSTAGVINSSHFFDPISPSYPKAKAFAYNASTQKLALIGDMQQTVGGIGVMILQVDIATWTVDWYKTKQGSFDNNGDTPINIFFDPTGNVVAVGLLREKYIQNGTQNYEPTFIESFDNAGIQNWEKWYFHTAGVYKYPTQTKDAKMDANGNVYLCGNSYHSFSESFIVKFANTSSTAPVWDKRFDSPIPYSERAKGIGLDNSGNSYTVITSAEIGENEDAVVLKHDASVGTQLFKYQYSDVNPGNGLETAIMSKCDANGNTYILYNSRGNSKDLNISLIKYNASGAIHWHYHYDNSGSYDLAESFILDPAGYVYITGKSYAFGANFSEVFLTKLQTSNGGTLWVKNHSFSASTNDSGKDLVLDAAGNIIVMAENGGNGSGKLLQYSPAGVLYNATHLPVNFYADGKLAFNGTDIVVALSSSGNADIKINWYNTASNTLVTKSFAPGANHAVADIKADASGNIYVLVNYRNGSNINNSEVVKYSNTQTQLWSGLINYSGTYDYGVNLLLASNGDVIATGYHNQTGENNNVDITSLNSATGTANWNRQVNFENRVDQPKSIVENNGLYLISAISSFYPSVCGITSVGGIAFTKILHQDYQYGSNFISCFSAGSFIVSGHFNYPSFSSDLFIEKYTLPNYWTGNLSTAWENAGNWSENVPQITDEVYIGIFHLNLPTVNSNGLCNELIVHKNANLTLAPASTLKVNSNLFTDGTITAQQDATNFSQLLCNGTITGSGIINAEKYIKSTGYLHLGSPFTDALLDIGEPGYTMVSENSQKGNLWVWNASLAEWQSPNINSNFSKGKGYSVYAGSNVYGNFTAAVPGKITLQATTDKVNNQVVYSSTFYNNGQGVAATFVGGTSTAATQGWNFLANPYLCNYKWDGQVVGSSNQAYYIWDGSQYSSYVTGGGTNNATGYIPPFHGFWVQRTGGAYQNFIFQTSQRTVLGGSAYKTNSINPQIKLAAISSVQPGLKDEILLEFHPLGNDNFEGDKDALKLRNAETMPMLWSIADENLSINRCKEFEVEKQVPLGFSSATAGNYFIAPNLDDIPSHWTVYLEDQITNKWHDFKGGDFQFSHQAQNRTNRFVLHFYKTNPPKIEDGKKINAWVFVADEQLTVRFSNTSDRVSVFVSNSFGQELFSANHVTTSADFVIPVNRKNQILVVNVVGNHFSESFKVVF